MKRNAANLSRMHFSKFYFNSCFPFDTQFAINLNSNVDMLVGGRRNKKPRNRKKDENLNRNFVSINYITLTKIYFIFFRNFIFLTFILVNILSSPARALHHHQQHHQQQNAKQKSCFISIFTFSHYPFILN